VTQLYPRVLGSLFVASYDSQGYGGGILTRLHTGYYFVPFKNDNYMESVTESVTYFVLVPEIAEIILGRGGGGSDTLKERSRK
jgi:hypothetical protein